MLRNMDVVLKNHLMMQRTVGKLIFKNDLRYGCYAEKSPYNAKYLLVN